MCVCVCVCTHTPNLHTTAGLSGLSCTPGSPDPRLRTPAEMCHSKGQETRGTVERSLGVSFVGVATYCVTLAHCVITLTLV